MERDPWNRNRVEVNVAPSRGTESAGLRWSLGSSQAGQAESQAVCRVGIPSGASTCR